MRHHVLPAVALIAAIGCAPASAHDLRRSQPSQLTARWLTIDRSPPAVISMWIEARAQALPAPCGLVATTYRSKTATAIEDFHRALVEPLPLDSQPGHRLYLVVLITQTGSARYLLDLVQSPHRHWQVDLWAEL